MIFFTNFYFYNVQNKQWKQFNVSNDSSIMQVSFYKHKDVIQQPSLFFNMFLCSIHCSLPIFASYLSRYLYSSGMNLYFTNTVKPMGKGHPRESTQVTFLQRWPFSEGDFYRFLNHKPLLTVWPLFEGYL